MSGGDRPLGRRRRRLYWTSGLLVLAVLLSSLVTYAIYRSSRPRTYSPGEELAEITSRLDRGIPDGAPRPSFHDVTAASGLDRFRAFSGARTSQLPEDMGPGAAWGDHDGDGDDDLFVVSQGGPIGSVPADRSPSRLYENRGDGTFADVESFPDTRILGMGAAWGDHDGDGDLDLVVSGYNALRLFRNDAGTLVRDPAIAERDGYWAGVSWSDFDLDGDLDLYVCGYVEYVEATPGTRPTSRQYGRAVPYTLNPAAFEPHRNLLLRNDGQGGFEDVAESLGVANLKGRSLGALWHDFDEDGRPDLYVANDISDNALYLNRDDGFEDVSHPAWVADYRGAMGLAAADWNRDGDEDLFITHWVAQENALYDSLLVDSAGQKEKPTLHFVDVADQRGLGQIALQLIGWGTEFADFDSDGWLDLVVANGSTFEDEASPPALRPQPSFLFWNHGSKSFHDLSPLIPALAEAHVSRGLALSDYDSDGDVDLLFVDRDGGVRLLRNDTPQGNRVALRLVRPSGAPVEGTRVAAHIPSGVVRQTLNSVSYLSQSSRTMHLGVGNARQVERLEVRWPGGDLQAILRTDVNVLLELTEGESEPRRIATWGTDSATSLSGQELAEFWRRQRAAMDAMKIDGDHQRAIDLFEQALELNPSHEDSLYYLANALAGTGDIDKALERLAELMRRNHQSHRAHKRWGTLRASTARSASELDDAVDALKRAAEINPEETGVSLVLGEVELMRGNAAASRQRLEWVVRSNPHSGEAFFVLAYLAWDAGDDGEARRRLEQALGTRKEDWKPSGAVAEGEVRRKMHVESSPFEDLYEEWDGTLVPEAALPKLRARLNDLAIRRT